MRLKKMSAKFVIVVCIAMVLTGCGNTNSTEQNQTNTQTESMPLKFPIDSYTTQMVKVDGNEVTYRAYENIVYIENPVDAKYQCMNIYIPDAYFNNGTIGEFTAETAPIFLPNNVGGYLPAEPGVPSMQGAIDGDASRAGMTSDGENKGTPNSLLMALSKGYVVASPGARGRSNEDSDGTYTGKAPAAIVDLKAAVRYLHYNNEVMPGNADRIISNGTSAGGALSVLLGASGNHTDYEVYLNELGAAEASDAIYAVSAYCPITNLDNADMAYEWLFNGIDNYEKMNITNVDGVIHREKQAMTLTEDQIIYSDALKSMFPDYVNSLNLQDINKNSLILDAEGNGPFENYVIGYIAESAQQAIDAGEDLSDKEWMTITDGKVTEIDFEGYIQELGRSKAAPAFDAVDLSQPENSLFGTEKVDAQHFTAFSLEQDQTKGSMASEKVIAMMNPMTYIGREGTDAVQYWRIRQGEKDSDTAIAIPVILALKLESQGCHVDFSVPWGQGHGGDYDLVDLFNWIDSII